MKIEELGLKIFDTMELQIGDNVDQRYPVKFYGYNPHGSIIVSAPKSAEDKMIFVRESLLVTMRFIVNNVATGFTSRVLATRGQPYPYLHLEIPKEIQTVQVNQGLYIKTHISATIMNKTQKSAASIVQIIKLSCSSIKIEAKLPFAEEDNLLSITSALKYEKLERLITMDCIVKSVTDKKNGSFVYELEIKQIDEEDLLYIKFYIYQEKLKNLHMI